MKIKPKDIILIILLLLLITINISLYLNKILLPMQNNEKVKQAYEDMKNPEAFAEEQTEANVEEEIAEQEKLAQMGEQQRIRYYVSNYLSYLDEKDYEKAYNLLYPSFRDSYFATQEEYENYIREKYPRVTTVTYGETRREGQYYILDVTIKDLQNVEDTTKQIEQKFIVYETGYNEFTISFQVK